MATSRCGWCRAPAEPDRDLWDCLRENAPPGLARRYDRSEVQVSETWNRVRADAALLAHLLTPPAPYPAIAAEPGLPEGYLHGRGRSLRDRLTARVHELMKTYDSSEARGQAAVDLLGRTSDHRPTDPPADPG